jgi:hypothetical protein
MKRLLLAFVISASVLAIGQSGPRDIDVTASDGTHLKATFHAANGAANANAKSVLR